jgi:hypothetical protein
LRIASLKKPGGFETGVSGASAAWTIALTS